MQELPSIGRYTPEKSKVRNDIFSPAKIKKYDFVLPPGRYVGARRNKG